MLRYIVILCVFINQCCCARILSMIPTPSISHQVVFRPLVEALAQKGHQLVLITTDPLDRKLENLTQIDLHDVSYPIWNRLNFPDLRNMNRNAFQMLLMKTMLEIVEKQFSTSQLQDLIHNPDEHFDLCIVESWIPVVLGFKERFNCVMILMTSLSAGFDAYDAIGNPTNPALYPDVYSTSYNDLNFLQRLVNVYDDLSFRYQHYYEIFPMFEKLSRKIFPNNTKTLWELQKQTDLLFVTMNPLLESIKPTLPTVVVLGNMHIKRKQILPTNLQSILDNSKNGVIYFSLGSNVKSVELSLEKRLAFLDAFAELPFTVLWKWENDTLPNKPSNVYCLNWMPQQDILAHPNVKAFITQGGYQSLEEGIYYKTPLIAIPFYSDQFFNANKIAKMGIGKQLSFNELSKHTIKRTIMEVVEDSGYYNRIKKLSNVIHDQPNTSIERAIWWTEYALRHNGTSHFRSPIVDMPIYQHFLLDIIAFSIAIICMILYLTKIMIKSILSNINKNKNNKIKLS